MAGHSHWAGIKYKKGANDAKRGKLFTKLGKQITVAAKMGGGDMDVNFGLRHAVDDAKAANMPKDNIEKAIKRGTGELDGVQIESQTFEGYGPSGVAILVEALTDNKNRTTSEIRKIFETKNGNMGQSGCVSWMFKRKGIFVFSSGKTTEDELMEAGLENGVEDIEQKDDVFEVTCDYKSFYELFNAFKEAGLQPDMSELAFIADVKVTLDKDAARPVLSLIESLDDHDDVQNVHANIELPDDVIKEMSE